MSLPLLKDIDKLTKDLLEEDFTVTKHTVKVKATAPNDVGVTTTTDVASSIITSKIAFKWAHPSGFVLDKLELSGPNKPTIEASHVKLFPGLKVEIKSNAAICANLGAIYRHEFATLAVDGDCCGGAQAINASVVAGKNGLMIGGGAKLGCNCGDSAKCNADVQDYRGVIAYRPYGANFYVDVKGNKKFNAFNSAIHYKALPTLSVAAMVDFIPKDSSKKFTFGAEHLIPQTNSIVKLKVNNDGIATASIKHDIRERRLTLQGAAEVNVKNLEGIKYGFSATLG